MTRPQNLPPEVNPHRATPSVPNPPRFRALALFGRRLPERVVGIVVPASENLRTNGLMHCSKQPQRQSCSRFPYILGRDRLLTKRLEDVRCGGGNSLRG
jgi:hypothetical protein